jgi:ABC-type glycerol-3-phosphate transport system permease component
MAFALSVAMFPPVSIIGPLFNMWRYIGLYDTWQGLILPYISLTLPLAIWTLAAAVVVTVPLIILVMVFQRRIVAGLTAGAIKG